MSEANEQAVPGTTGGVRVNGEPVPAELIRREEDMLRRRYAETAPEADLEAMAEQIADDARQNAIERVLLAQTARSVVGPVPRALIDSRMALLKRQAGGGEAFPDAMGLSPDDEGLIRDGIAEDIRLDRYFEELCRDVPRPTAAECRAWYEAHPAQFQGPEAVRARHILRRPAPAEPAAAACTVLLNLRERILKGEDFLAVAREYSDADDGGDLGYVARGQMPETFERVLFALEPDAVSDVFPSEFGHHIVQALDRRPAGIRPFAEVRHEVEDLLWTESKNARIGEVVDGLRVRARIETP